MHFQDKVSCCAFLLFVLSLVSAVSSAAPNKQCPYGNFACKNGKQCLPMLWKCDGENDCGDSSDEDPFICSVRTLTPTTPEQTMPGKTTPGNTTNTQAPNKKCANGTFACKNGKYCLLNQWKCDGDDDCGDSSDEDPLMCLPNKKCANGKFACKNGKYCLSNQWKCDGADDCGDSSDEDPLMCPKRKHCEDTEFECNNRKCIPISWKCDDEQDCGDGSDEQQLMCKIEAKINNKD